MDLKQVVISVSKDWRQISGDSNLFDVLFEAHRIVKALAIAVPSDVPAKDIGVRLVEIVGCTPVPPEELARRAEAVVRALEKKWIRLKKRLNFSWLPGPGNREDVKTSATAQS